MQFFDTEFDEVVKSIFCSGKTSYKYAMDFFFPQIDKYYAQRKKQNEKFYEKLERDLKKGCIMPPITIALVVGDLNMARGLDVDGLQRLFEDEKENLYILDGIQRLNTLSRAYSEAIAEKNIYFNLLISDSDDRLLYRMITLNNGQKPMSARHQIEVLAYNIFDFGEIELPVQTEKERAKKRIRGSFDKDDIIKSYIAYLSGSVNIDNQKIIESKMDELVAEKIIDSEVTQGEQNFKDVIGLVEKFIESPFLHSWFKQTNNLIGFSSAIGSTYRVINEESTEDFQNNVVRFEETLEDFNVSKVKLGHLRRLTVHYFISKYDTLKDASQIDLREKISEATMLFM